jgi:hypothetical protein
VSKPTPEEIAEHRRAILKHRYLVMDFLGIVINELSVRGDTHDESKLHEPELEAFALVTPKLATTTYGSEEYKANLRSIKPAVDHHQQTNRHHPEFHGDLGMRGMNLVDLVEMICDWKAASMRHNDGDCRKSIELNQKRFGYSDDLKAILLNTVDLLTDADSATCSSISRYRGRGRR